ncbi:tRNA (adenosine(37)-N6)-threonylcarbamoyltransferase complex ATPase subunit type 1 TsaE [Miniphocaeibacter massiliensis]|uniref:tRNA (adenosine(37)-N6)-threonylcarbamoyltransferase complex ATPase subunit type 1 TsaE n=1 Tax=Miniphocaeibacter massiliensis TaxID=2041841 RepID=UPI000C07B3D7|nr:tRNA (adenosine(37)-N6)-threonylcarbamoyltransferase complex ATPase subunit type 1 TsaE [Miniphocaeibacter massiliensis]
MFKYISKNEIDTNKFAKAISKYIDNGTLISLNGEMGAGKTTFTKMFADALNIQNYVTSPTFSLVNSYNGDKELNHLDLYRIEDESEVESIDIDTYYYPDGITLVEWAERASSYLPKYYIEIKINKVGDTQREFVIEGKNKLENKLIERLEKDENIKY